MQKFDYKKSDIIQALLDVGVKSGDNIFIHSNIGFFGRLKGAKDIDSFYRIFKESIFEVIGESGTLVVPTFSYSFCWEKKFDLQKTTSVCGLFSEKVRLDSDSLRSCDANFSVAAIGNKACYFTENVSEYSFGKNSFWNKFLELDGKFCNFNFDSASTFIHYVERELKVDYRFDKCFSGKIIDGDKEISKQFYHFCYDLNKPEYAAYFSKFDKKSRDCGFSKTSNLGKGQVVSIGSKETFSLIKKELLEDPYFLVKIQK